LFLGILAGPEPLSRNAVDDTTILVVFFDRLEGDGKGGKAGGGGGGGNVGKAVVKEKKWWWPL
jgi:pyruvate dehydrogenase phosphatase